MNYLSTNIKFLRKSQGFSLSYLANELHCSMKEMEQAEKKSGKVDIKLLIQLSKYFKHSIDVLVNVNLDVKNKKAKQIKFIVFDIDGVLTDGGMYYTEKGDQFKKFDTKDGLMIKRLSKSGMKLGFLSNGLNSKLIKSRADLLGVHKVYVGTKEKLSILDEWIKTLRISYKNVAYIGDDLNDMAVIKKVGFSACPANAADAIKKEVDVILSKNGGEACVREWLDGYF